jgi:hypothetical protein
MSDIPHPRTHDEDAGPDLQSGDDLDTGAIVGGTEVNDEEPDDGAGSEAS